MLAICALTLCCASSASAATYSVYSCEGPTGLPVANAAWSSAVENPSQSATMTFLSSCGNLGVSGSVSDSFTSGDGGAWNFAAPSGTTISSYKLTRSARVFFAGGIGSHNLRAGIREMPAGPAVYRDCSLSSIDCEVPSSVVERGGLALSSLSVGVSCAQSGGCPPGSFTQLNASLAKARVDLEDSTAPQITGVGGTLPNSSSAAAITTLLVNTSDVGGGVARTELSIDGGPWSTISSGGNCAQPYLVRRPCPLTAQTTFAVDTSSFSAGTHIGIVRTFDAADNGSSQAGFVFTVASGGAGGGGELTPSNGTPAVLKPVVRTDKSVIQTAGSGSVRVQGRLSTEAGEPISGAVLQVSALDLAVFGSQERSLGEVTTTANGQFSVSVRPNGARRISVSFKPAPEAVGTAVASAVVRQALSLSVKASKQRVKPRGNLTLSGKLSGAGAARSGAPVEIDVKINGRWRAVGVVETGRAGGYRWRYRFARVTQPTRFIFRAQVRSNKAWPWSTKKSRIVKVLVA